MKPVLSTESGYGAADPDKYNLGRGKLLADFYDDVTNLPTGMFTDLGNAPAFALNIDEETLEHTSSRTGVSAVDAVVTLSKKLGGSFTLDEFGADQLAAFLSATVSEVVVTTITYTDASRLDISADIPADAGGRVIELYKADGTRHRGITGFALWTLATGGTAYTADTDYIVDLDAGTLFIVAGGLLDVATPAAFCDFVQPAGNNVEVRMMEDTTVRAALLFLGENAQTGQKYEVRLHKCKIISEGDAGLIGDDWGSTGFTFVAEVTTDTAYSASPVGTIIGFNPD